MRIKIKVWARVKIKATSVNGTMERSYCLFQYSRLRYSLHHSKIPDFLHLLFSSLFFLIFIKFCCFIIFNFFKLFYYYFLFPLLFCIRIVVYTSENWDFFCCFGKII